MQYFIGILDGAKKTWGLRIPDLPGCFGGGESADAAVQDGISAARVWAEHRTTKGAALPVPTAIDKIRLQMLPGETAVRVPVFLDAGRSVRANLSLDAGLLQAIDDAAGKRGLTRSSFIASAARAKIMGEA